MQGSAFFVKKIKNNLLFYVNLGYNEYKYAGKELCRMDYSTYWKIIEKSREPEAAEKTVAYLAEHLGKFLQQLLQSCGMARC